MSRTTITLNIRRDISFTQIMLKGLGDPNRKDPRVTEKNFPIKKGPHTRAEMAIAQKSYLR